MGICAHMYVEEIPPSVLCYTADRGSVRGKEASHFFIVVLMISYHVRHLDF